MNTDLVEELFEMREKFDEMESDMSVTRKVNTLLSKRLQTIEWQCLVNAQYSKRKCVEISRFLSPAINKNLQEVTCISITKAGVELCDRSFKDRRDQYLSVILFIFRSSVFIKSSKPSAGVL